MFLPTSYHGFWSKKNASPLLHHLDDFLLVAPPKSSACSNNLQYILETCSHLGIPLAKEKIEGPTKTLTFLGITLDTQNMEARLPPDKLHIICKEIKAWLNQKDVKRGHFIIRGPSATRHKSCQIWENIRVMNVRNSGKSKKVVSTNQTHC